MFRILFFKLFNKIETWEYIKNALGEITYSSYNYERYNQLLMERMGANERIYSAAYIMPSGKSRFGYEKKHQNNLKLLEYMMESGLPQQVAKAKSLEELYEVLLAYPRSEPSWHFNLQLILITVNYVISANVICGCRPGSKEWNKKMFW